ncbi:MAG TPA: undecaprenyl-phosphate glucose phosphotransferase [Steroidobacteraceae bacterium]|nr:undecaprenyl-phosphate glucose phosphotransferase [Steroidobacteraceae bacterium]
MTEPLFFTHSSRVTLVVSLQFLLPPLVAAALLYIMCALDGKPFTVLLHTVAAVTAILTVLLPRGRANGNGAPAALAAPSEAARFTNGQLPLAARVVMRWMVIVAILLGIGYFTRVSGSFPRRIFLSWAIATPAALILVNSAVQEFARRLLYDPSVARRVAFVGCNEVSLALAQRIEANCDLGLRVHGFFDDRSATRLGAKSGAARILGTLAELASYVKRRGVDVIFIALPVRHIQRVVNLLDELRDTTASVYYVPDIFVFDLIQARTGEILGVPVVALCETPFCGYRGVVKRITDVALAAAILVFAVPIMLAIAIAVKLSSAGPILFKQRRYGLDGEEIIVYKFRTMTVAEDGAEVLQARKSDRRVTPVGRFLRRHSLDELPQLFNVLQGHMSLVGPRPHAIAHNEEYRKLIKGYMIRHKVPPGITGLAQVNGYRGETAQVEEMRARVEYDLEYLRHWSPLLDLKILAVTAMRLLRDEKAY